MLAAVNYCVERREPDFKGGEKYIWPEIKAAIDEAAEREEAIRLARAEGGKLGGRPKQTFTQMLENLKVIDSPSSPLQPPINPLKDSVSKDTPKKSPQNASAFAQFWAAYPKKKNKVDAEKAFKQVKEPIETLLKAIEQQKLSPDWQKEGGQFIPYPATWLRRGAWMDETPSLPNQEESTDAPLTSRWIATGDFEGYREYLINGEWVRRE